MHRYPFGPHGLYDREEDPREVSNRVDDPGCATELEYVDPAQDGARLPVTGSGQIDFADRRNRGRRAFQSVQGNG